MTIKRKLTGMIIVAALAVVTVSALSVYTFWSIQRGVDVVEANIGHLYNETKVRVMILRQVKESIDILNNRSVDELQGYRERTVEIRKAIDEWVSNMEKCRKMDKDTMSDNISRARRIHKEYDTYIDEVDEALSLAAAGKLKEAKGFFIKTIEPLTYNVLFQEMDRAVQYDTVEIGKDYDRVLQHIGAMFLYAAEGRRDVQIARTAVDYYLAVDELRVQIMKQLKEIIDYQFFDDEDEKYDFVRHDHDATQAIERWHSELREHRGLGMEGEDSDVEKNLEVSDMYARLHSLSEEALYYIDSGQKKRAFNLVERGIEHFLDEVMMVYLDRVVDDSKNELKYAHDQIRSFSHMASIRIGIFIALFSGLILFVLIKVVRQMLSSVNTIYNGTVQIGAGFLDHRIDIKTGDEFEVLSRAINAMTASLKNTTISRDYLDDIIMSMQDGLFIIGVDGMIKKVNGAACDMLGYSERELLSMHITGILEQGYYREDESNTEILEGLLGKKERVLVGRDGSTVPVIISSSSMHDRTDKRVAMVSIVKDISEIKMTEEHLTHLTQKLISYSEDLEEANEDIRSFASIVSHDLRAPLRNISGFSKQLGEAERDLKDVLERYYEKMSDEDREKIQETIDRDIHESLEYIATSVDRMDGQIKAILNLSRIGRRDLVPEEVAADEVVRGILSSLGHQIEKKKVAVVVGELPAVVADRTSIEQILGNLIDNALKYMESEREGELEVGGEERGEYVIYRVRDNGRGIAKEDIGKVFDIFRRVGKQDVEGEGMGLAYVKTMVRRLGGRIWCKSEVGEGTEFGFSVPKEVLEEEMAEEGKELKQG